MHRIPAGGRLAAVSRAGGLGVLAFALLVVGGAGALAEAEPVVLPSRQITMDPTPVRAHSQPEILVHPGDPRTLAIVEGSFLDGTCHTHVSRDGGRTWATRAARPQPTELPSCTRPAFGAFLDAAFGADGTLYFAGAASADHGSVGPTIPYVARSTDLGESWEIALLAEAEETDDFTDHEGVTRQDEGRYSYTRMAVHPTDPDVVYVGYRYEPATLGFDEAPRRTRIAVSNDGGRTWSEFVDAFANLPPDEVYGSDQPALAVAADGTVHAFTKERPAPDAELFPRLLMSTSIDGGATWQGRVADDDVAICGPCLTTPEAAIDPDSGSVYVVFELSESPPPDAREDRDVWAIVSRDDGETFSDRIRLNDGLDPERDPDNNQMFPGIDIAPNGRVDVAWYDFRSDRRYNPDGSRGTADHVGDLYWDVYYTSSADGGSTWAPNVRISDRSMHRQDGYAMNVNYHLGGPISVAATDRETHFAWSDSRNGRPEAPAEDVYYTAALHETAAPAPRLSVASAAVGGAAGLVVAGLLVIVVAFQLGRRLPRAR